MELYFTNNNAVNYKKFSAYFELLILALMWSPGAVITKYLFLQGFSSLSIVASSSLIAGLTLYFISLVQGFNLKLSKKYFMHCVAMAVLVQISPYFCFVKSLEYIDTIWSAIILATIPLITMFLANIVFPDTEKLTIKRLMAGLLGFIGLIVIFSSSIKEATINYTTLLGVSLAFGASLLNACGMIYGKKYLGKVKPSVAALYQTLIGGSFLLPFVNSDHIVSMLSNPQSLKHIFIIGIFCTAFPIVMYYRIVQKHGAFCLATVNYILPIIKTAAGVIFLNEMLSGRFIAASMLILTALFLAN